MGASQADVGNLSIRPLESLDDFNQTLKLQELIWGFDVTDTVASRLFGVFNHIGGSSLGAFLGGEMVGYTLAFAGFKADHKPYWHSHMAGVVPSMHNLGIGQKLKLRQREEALAAGLDLIEWTFDPLQARNAFFNIEKLGTTIEAYLPNFYGITSSALHGHRPTDRVLAAWHLSSPSVLACLAGRQLQAGDCAMRIEIPARISEISRRETIMIQETVREQFQRAFDQGLRVAGFARGSATGAYVLDRTAPDLP